MSELHSDVFGRFGEAERFGDRVGGGMVQALPGAQWDPSALIEFDAGDLLDAVSLGIIVLDAQFCAVYANTTAEDVLAVRLESLRGLPFASFLPQPKPFLDALRQALESGEAVVFDLPGYAPGAAGGGDTLNLRLKRVRDQLTGTYLLLEMRATSHASSSR